MFCVPVWFAWPFRFIELYFAASSTCVVKNKGYFFLVVSPALFRPHVTSASASCVIGFVVIKPSQLIYVFMWPRLRNDKTSPTSSLCVLGFVVIKTSDSSSCDLGFVLIKPPQLRPRVTSASSWKKLLSFNLMCPQPRFNKTISASSLCGLGFVLIKPSQIRPYVTSALSW